MWALVLVLDDESFVHLMDAEFADYSDYCQVLKVGDGEEPTKEENQAATQKYTVYQNKTD